MCFRLPAAEEEGWKFASSTSPSTPKCQSGCFGESADSIATQLEHKRNPRHIHDRSAPLLVRSVIIFRAGRSLHEKSRPLLLVSTASKPTCLRRYVEREVAD